MGRLTRICLGMGAAMGGGAVFKGDADGLPLDRLRELLAAFGQPLSDKEFGELIKDIDVAPGGSLSLEQFSQLMGAAKA